MPIRPEFRWLYPVDWPQLSAMIRFERAKGRCECCGRPHGQVVHHLGDGRWWDEEQTCWRSGKGRALTRPAAFDVANPPAKTLVRSVKQTAESRHAPLAKVGESSEWFSEFPEAVSWSGLADVRRQGLSGNIIGGTYSLTETRQLANAPRNTGFFNICSSALC
jgi:hypothetical protein